MSDAVNPTENKFAREILGITTSKNHLNIYDNLELDKVRIKLAKYDLQNKLAYEEAYAFVSTSEIRVLAQMVSFGGKRFSQVFPYTPGSKTETGYLRMKGSTVKGNPPRVESRIMQLTYAESVTKDGKTEKRRQPYFMKISNGPGAIIGKGIVQPNGSPTANVIMSFGEFQLMEILTTVNAYIERFLLVKTSLQERERVKAIVTAELAKEANEATARMNNARSPQA